MMEKGNFSSSTLSTAHKNGEKKRKKQLIEITISFLCQKQKGKKNKIQKKTWEKFLRNIFLSAVVKLL